MVNRLFIFIAFSLLITSCHTTQKCNNTPIITLDEKEFEELILTKDIQLIDVRTLKEYTESHIPQASNIDVKKKNFKRKIRHLSSEKPVAVYCRGGVRSMKAAIILQKKGFTVFNLEKGFHAWKGTKTN